MLLISVICRLHASAPPALDHLTTDFDSTGNQCVLDLLAIGPYSPQAHSIRSELKLSPGWQNELVHSELRERGRAQSGGQPLSPA